MRALNQPLVRHLIEEALSVVLPACGIVSTCGLRILWQKDGLVPEQVTGFSVAFADRISLVEHIVADESVFQLYYHPPGADPVELGVPVSGWRNAIDEYVRTLVSRQASRILKQSWVSQDRPVRTLSPDNSLPPVRFGV